MEYLNKNIAGQELWDNSFMGRLLEDGFWDKEEFWHLHAELTRYCMAYKDKSCVSRDVASNVARIIFLIMKLYAAHKDPNDVFKIKGIDDEELHEFIERVELLSVSLFSGDIYNENDFDLRNPYLLNA